MYLKRGPHEAESTRRQSGVIISALRRRTCSRWYPKFKFLSGASVPELGKVHSDLTFGPVSK